MYKASFLLILFWFWVQICISGKVIRFTSCEFLAMLFNLNTSEMHRVWRHAVSVQTGLHCPQFNNWRYLILLYSAHSYNHLPNKQLELDMLLCLKLHTFPCLHVLCNITFVSLRYETINCSCKSSFLFSSCSVWWWLL